jgi:heme-degrading monooxygenase HmoA
VTVKTASGFVVRSRFVVANAMVEEVRAAFRHRRRCVDAAPGFVRLEVLSPHNRPTEFWLLTYWTDRRSYVDWRGDHTDQQWPSAFPPDLKLTGSGTEICQLEFISA